MFGPVLSNLGLVSAASPVYGAITGPITSLAIVWLLFAVDLRDLRAAGPRTLAAFGITACATVVGALLATLTFADTFGAEAWKLAGVLTSTYIGGSLNFVSVGRELGLPDALFTAATAADNVVTALWIGATLMLPVWLGRADPEDTVAPEHPFFGAVSLRLLDIALLLALGLGLLVAAESVAARTPAIPSVLWLTTFALAAGQLPAVRRLSGAMQLGTLALHFFFAVIGIGSRVAEIARVGPEIFYLTAMVVAIHGVLTYGAARVAGLDVATGSVASQAAVGGPSSALALAAAREWPALVLPGTVAGLFGYAVGNYLGFGPAYVVRGVVGG